MNASLLFGPKVVVVVPAGEKFYQNQSKNVAIRGNTNRESDKEMPVSATCPMLPSNNAMYTL